MRGGLRGVGRWVVGGLGEGRWWFGDGVWGLAVSGGRKWMAGLGVV